MIHHRVRDDTSGDHWACNHNESGVVLAQLQERGEQVRLALTPEQAEQFGHALLASAQRAREALAPARSPA